MVSGDHPVVSVVEVSDEEMPYQKEQQLGDGTDRPRRVSLEEIEEAPRFQTLLERRRKLAGFKDKIVAVQAFARGRSSRRLQEKQQGCSSLPPLHETAAQRRLLVVSEKKKSMMLTERAATGYDTELKPSRRRPSKGGRQHQDWLIEEEKEEEHCFVPTAPLRPQAVTEVSLDELARERESESSCSSACSSFSPSMPASMRRVLQVEPGCGRERSATGQISELHSNKPLRRRLSVDLPGLEEGSSISDVAEATRKQQQQQAASLAAFEEEEEEEDGAARERVRRGSFYEEKTDVKQGSPVEVVRLFRSANEAALQSSRTIFYPSKVASPADMIRERAPTGPVGELKPTKPLNKRLSLGLKSCESSDVPDPSMVVFRRASAPQALTTAFAEEDEEDDDEC